MNVKEEFFRLKDRWIHSKGEEREKADAEMQACFQSILASLFALYQTYFIMGLFTTIIERKHIHCKSLVRKVLNIFTFPLFMLTYIPLIVAALFLKVDWVPTPHSISLTLDDVVGEAN